MRTELRCLLLCSVGFLCGMRDPFRPPETHCVAGPLTQWHYQGMIGGAQHIGIVQDEHQRWHRVREGQLLSEGWRVLTVTDKMLVLDIGEGCEPKEWRWIREGNKNERKMESRSVADVHHSGLGRDTKARQSDR